jgi:hypothetical protein
MTLRGRMNWFNFRILCAILIFLLTALFVLHWKGWGDDGRFEKT